MKLKSAIFALASFLFTYDAFAGSITSTVRKVGCHIDHNHCFVYLNETIEDKANCGNNSSLRWDGSGNTSQNVQAALSILLTAKTTGQAVEFGSAGETCFGGYTSFTSLELH
ncbi:hypothetical protein ACJJH9_13065 [Microbulbifer sp. DLAB2-AF]|uniref:hypothetical protein n=1 Tax=Microbulbifer sp. DLAB2-AF TaxID=3243395 RepID=UPI0040393A85